MKKNLENAALLLLVPAYFQIKKDHPSWKNFLISSCLPLIRSFSDPVIYRFAIDCVNLATAPNEPNIKIIEGLFAVTVAMITANAVDFGASSIKSGTYSKERTM